MAAHVDDIVCSEEKIKLFRTKFTTLITETFFPKKEPNYNAVVISNCNGQGSWSFSDATINYTLPRNFPASMFFISGFEEIDKYVRQCLNPVKEGEQTNIAGSYKTEQMVKKFINTVMSVCLNEVEKELLEYPRRPRAHPLPRPRPLG